jgi:hypothetical protein
MRHEVLDNNIGRNNTAGDTIGWPRPPAKPGPQDHGHPGRQPDPHRRGDLGQPHPHDFYGIYIDGLVRATSGGAGTRPVR